MSMNTLYMRVENCAGSSIRTVVRELGALAGRVGISVETEFNGYRIFIQPWFSPNDNTVLDRIEKCITYNGYKGMPTALHSGSDGYSVSKLVVQ